MVQSQSCITGSMFHSSDEDCGKLKHTYCKKKVAPNTKRKMKRKKERRNTSWMRRKGREAEVWQCEEEERRYSCPQGEKERKEG